MVTSSRPLTVAVVAQRLGCVPKTVRRLIHTGKLAAFRVGRDWRVQPDALASYVARRGQ